MEYTLMALRFNNYYDRILRVGKTTDDYEAADGHPYYEYGVYFRFGDSVETSMPVNNNVDGKDYVVLIDENQEISSRWFIIDSYYELNGQQNLVLRRDLVADFYKDALYSTAFIEKGWLQARNKLIFNQEGMTFNQIKKDELLLKDGTGIPWIVGYYPNNAEISGTVQLPNAEYDVIVESNFAEWKYYKYFDPASTGMPGVPTSITFSLYNKGNRKIRTSLRESEFGYTATSDYADPPTGVWSADTSPLLSTEEFQSKVSNVLTGNYDIYRGLLESEYAGTPREEFEDVLSYNNLRVKFNDGIRLCSVKRGDLGPMVTYTATIGLDLSNRFISDLGTAGITVTTFTGQPWVQAKYLFFVYDCNATTTYGGEYAYAISKNHYTLYDAPYSMFCMPYGALTVMEGENSIVTDKDIQLAVATSMAEASGNVYDIQILPYCPIGEINSNQYTVTDTRAYDVIKIGETTAGYIFHCQRSSFTKRISLLPLPTWLTRRSDPVDVKVQNECEFIRFNSPNYASSWEMSVAKNEGVSWINVSATYLPYNPYIKVYPDFKGLYGGDFNDNRGLILSGDFSIPIITDLWKTYQLQSKNYEAMFDREIKNLDIQQKYGRLQDVVGIATGGFGAAGTGAALGSAMGPVGTAVGAGIGAMASVGAGIADLTINDKLRDEAKNYKKDMFGFQLGNIQALPNTLSKTTAYTIDNKYFPFIEYYSATPVEVSAFKDKLRYNGMTVGVIGRAVDYVLPERGVLTYVKAQLIRLYSIGDMHLSNQLAAEMAKGVYVNGDITERT